jgi:hypothetical protein
MTGCLRCVDGVCKQCNIFESYIMDRKEKKCVLAKEVKTDPLLFLVPRIPPPLKDTSKMGYKCPASGIDFNGKKCIPGTWIFDQRGYFCPASGLDLDGKKCIPGAWVADPRGYFCPANGRDMNGGVCKAGDWVADPNGYFCPANGKDWFKGGICIPGQWIPLSAADYKKYLADLKKKQAEQARLDALRKAAAEEAARKAKLNGGKGANMMNGGIKGRLGSSNPGNSVGNSTGHGNSPCKTPNCKCWTGINELWL